MLKSDKLLIFIIHYAFLYSLLLKFLFTGSLVFFTRFVTSIQSSTGGMSIGGHPEFLMYSITSGVCGNAAGQWPAGIYSSFGSCRWIISKISFFFGRLGQTCK